MNSIHYTSSGGGARQAFAILGRISTFHPQKTISSAMGMPMLSGSWYECS